MAANAITATPFSGRPRMRGGATAFCYRGTATATAQLLAGVADTTVYIWYIFLQPSEGDTWDLNIGDTTNGTVVRLEASQTATQAISPVFTCDKVLWKGGGSATAADNDINLTTDGTGTELCHYVICGWTEVADT